MSVLSNEIINDRSTSSSKAETFFLPLLGDFNGDGFSDVLCYSESEQTNIYISYSDPYSSSKGIFTTVTSAPFPWTSCQKILR